MEPLDCVFCAIARGDLPSYRVLDGDDVIAFLDIHPVAPGHTLVVPRRHAATLLEMPEAMAGPLFAAVARVARAVARAQGADGVNVLQANGPAAGQTVGHLHVHVVPRRHGDGLRLHIPSGPEATDRTAMAAQAERIAAALAAL
ncbi:MAG: HIT domain-containing protein [Firmicutes bacterium]|nr:HIT domain-containing protein [Bacillota bacterium]